MSVWSAVGPPYLSSAKHGCSCACLHVGAQNSEGNCKVFRGTRPARGFGVRGRSPLGGAHTSCLPQVRGSFVGKSRRPLQIVPEPVFSRLGHLRPCLKPMQQWHSWCLAALPWDGKSEAPRHRNERERSLGPSSPHAAQDSSCVRDLDVQTLIRAQPGRLEELVPLFTASYNLKNLSVLLVAPLGFSGEREVELVEPVGTGRLGRGREAAAVKAPWTSHLLRSRFQRELLLCPKRLPAFVLGTQCRAIGVPSAWNLWSPLLSSFLRFRIGEVLWEHFARRPTDVQSRHHAPSRAFPSRCGLANGCHRTSGFGHRSALALPWIWRPRERCSTLTLGCTPSISLALSEVRPIAFFCGRRWEGAGPFFCGSCWRAFVCWEGEGAQEEEERPGEGAADHFS